ncbi:NACHT domain-containing protein [Amycolatopsis vancoresmycina]|uniref:Signal transduction protein n=1 Tax=Amycolatopsis vancoresmycina DSM 44592 TaxID=1292037 RepID=R1FZH5_9PSEU|nr:NACHT domain-containing protein [Amycolatopsis vancoresmycina]EOD64697.1 signal transduction protein [Amycolatopsis vancoresmycina DSM 44592]
MTGHHNEITGGTFSGPVVQAGSIEQLSIHLGGEAPPRPPLTSWADRPELTPRLRDLLTAQQGATESLPYTLLGVRQPDLVDVYVQQTMRAQATDRSPEPDRGAAEPERRSGEPGERTLTMTEALNRGGHLLITGEPGAGKSTVGYMYVQQISKYWLGADRGGPPIAEPVLPVRIPARALAENAAWGELLASGLQAVLGQRLDEKPRPDLLARRALGARWLVFIDGLDEIVEPQTRAQVIAALADRIRRSMDHRLVITTRPLPHHELLPLERTDIDGFQIQPFSPVELEEFARVWFRDQNPLEPVKQAGQAAEFVRQIRDSRLRELVRNPLQATIAAIAHTLEPGRPLPNSRIDLYGRFMAYLLDEGASRRDTFAELRRGARDHPARLALLDWLQGQRVDLVEHLAVHRLETESPLIEAAQEWVTARRADVPDGWQGDLRAVLTGTGVFVPREGDLEFRHHSFAEFLAARSRAGEIPAEFPDLEEWIERGLSGAKRVFALFTFVLWGRENHDVGRVLRALLQGTGERVLLAGRLVGEGIDVDDELTAAVVDRLLDLLVCQGVRDDPWDDVESVGEVLSLLMPQMLGSRGLDRLRALRDGADLAEAIRIEAAAVLGRLTDAQAAADWLEGFLRNASLAGMRRGAEVLREVVPDGARRVDDVVTRIAATNEHDRVLTMALISLLLQVDRTASAAKMVRDLVDDLRAGADFEEADFAYTENDSRLADSWDEGVASWGVLADLAARAGCQDEALWAARRAFVSPDPRVAEFRDAVDAVLSVGQPDAVAEVVGATAERSTRHLVEAAAALQAKLHSAAALELASQALANPHAGEVEWIVAAGVFSSCNATDSLLEQVEKLPRQSAHRLIKAVSPFFPKSHPMVREAARLTITDGSFGYGDFDSACRVLLDGADQEDARFVYEASVNRGPDFWVRAAISLSLSGHQVLGDELIAKVRAGAAVDGWIDLALGLDDDKHSDVVTELLTAAVEQDSEVSEYRQRRFAVALNGVGMKAQAIRLVKGGFDESFGSIGPASWVELWIEIGGAAEAESISTEVLKRDINAEQRMSVAEEFAKAGLLNPAIKVWLDVLRHHGEAVDQGVLAAYSLAKCGHRADAAALLTGTLADKRLPARVRDRLRSLHAWVTAG